MNFAQGVTILYSYLLEILWVLARRYLSFALLKSETKYEFIKIPITNDQNRSFSFN